jgi:transcriptional regulator with XRE-family HTH domain
MGLTPADAQLFRERLAELRKERGFTQASLSEALDKGTNYIGRIETGEIDTPPLDTLAEIGRLLQVSISDLFFFEGKGDSAEELRFKIKELIKTDDISKLRKYYRLLLVSSEK